MEAIVIIGGAILLTYHSVKGEFCSSEEEGIYQENEQKDTKNDSFFIFPWFL